MGVIAGADQRTRFDVAEAHLQRFGFELGELTGRIEPGHGQVVARGAQVLADGEDVAMYCREVAEDFEQLAGLFAKADHDAGFRHAGGIQLLGIAQQFECPLIARAGTDHAIEPRDGFRVVIEDFRPRIDDSLNRFAVALEVGDEDFDATAWGLAANLIDDHGEDARAAHQIVVAIDAGDHCVLQAERGHGFRNAAGLVQVNGLGAALGHGAEAAAARAQVAEHHEGGGFVVPALADVGAVGALADGVQVEGTGQALEVVVVFADGGAGLQPLGLGRGNAGCGGDLDQFHAAVIVAGIVVQGLRGGIRDAAMDGDGSGVGNGRYGVGASDAAVCACGREAEGRGHVCGAARGVGAEPA